MRNQKGKAVLDFKGVPVEQVATLAAVLSGQLPLVVVPRRGEQPPPTT